MIISIINIICLIYGYISSLDDNHSLSPSTYNITIFFAITLILQFVNIVLLILLLKKDLNNRNQKKILILATVIVVVTLLVPVKVIHSIEYTFPTNTENTSILDIFNNMGSTTHINTYKNLYGLTLKNSKNTSTGIELY